MCNDDFVEMYVNRQIEAIPDHVKLEHFRAELSSYKAEIEAGILVRLPAAIGQMVYVQSGDGGIYSARVKDIACMRAAKYGPIMRAIARVGPEGDALEYLIAPENKGTHWFETEADARRCGLEREGA